jgi:hypothetical protein
MSSSFTSEAFLPIYLVMRETKEEKPREAAIVRAVAPLYRKQETKRSEAKEEKKQEIERYENE